MFKLRESFAGGRVAKIFGVEHYAPSMGALPSDGAISGPSNRFTDLVEVGEQASRRAVRRRFFRALNVCDTPATVALYGPDNRRASKLTVGIVLAENQEAVELKRWFAEPSDVREDARVAEEVLAYMAGLGGAFGLFTEGYHGYSSPDDMQ